MSAELQAMLYQALAQPIGLVVRCEDFKRDVQKLYRARTACADPSLDCLQFRRSPQDPDNAIWIVKLQGQSATAKTPTK